ncbi:hypothetical protein WICPIJ_003361 [Wickerhamomyces pijperi]|uniref:Chitin synthase export chaperone n=1 Tax=Wickerhamomyces pijperi TaxID=599730 RepID=A0A9P8Q9U0_WICPI|nr:hypothetical protein WICPIJ_003361 [Wickerhamomyces pijperi]
MVFGKFNDLCEKTSLPICQVLINGESDVIKTGILPTCYARPIELANTVIFQVGNAFVNIGALIILMIIIYNIRAKYTAIGRLEMLTYYHTLVGMIICSLVVDCGVTPPGSASYSYFVALQLAFASASCASLVFCGLLGFRLWEDGTKVSLWILRAFAFVWGVVTFIVALFTFHDWDKNHVIDGDHTTGLFVICYVINAVFLGLYLITQVVLATMVLQNYWVLSTIALSLISFVLGQIFVYVLSEPICQGVNHYIDGLFFGSLCNLFSIMMLYKFWDMTTDDDLEFSISINRKGEVFYDK